MISKIKRLFNRSKASTRDRNLDPGAFIKVVEGNEYRYAFTCGGVKSYEPVDYTNIPYMRGFEAQDLFDQLNRRVDKKYLDEFVKAFYAITNAPKIELKEINKLFFMLEQRREHVTNIEILYRLASIVFLDENENPLTYSPELGTIKMNRWKNDPDNAHGFFLQTHFKKFLPYSSLLATDSKVYMKQERKELATHFRHFSRLQDASE